MPDETVTITGEDIDSTAQKLTTFGQSLTASEKAVIDWILARATAADSDLSDSEVPGVLSGIEPATRGGVAFGEPESGAVTSSMVRALGIMGSRAAPITTTGSVGVTQPIGRPPTINGTISVTIVRK